MSGYFEKSILKSNHLLSELAFEMGDKGDVHRAGRVFRSVLHTLRDCLSPEESLQFIASLPLVIKGMYVDGWTLNRHDRIHNGEEFMLAVLRFNGMRDFQDEEDAVQAVSTVFKVLLRYVPGGEINDVIAGLPTKLKEFVVDMISDMS